MARRRLEGRRILVLRPEGQEEDLVRALAAEGGEAFRQHLAGLAARLPASDVTTFLLTAAVAEVRS